MATYTVNKGLEKPLSTEKYNVAVANKNNDVIDSELHKLDLKNQSQDNLLATKESLNAEISRAENKENEISQNLSDEITRVKSVESELNNSITNETNRAILTENNIQECLSNHIINESNPHKVTPEQLNLGNVDNTSDIDKPVSTAQQTAIDLAVTNHNISTTTSHTDIRNLISDLTTRLNVLADSDDTTLDQLSEIIAYIKSNRTLIENVTTNKANASDFSEHKDDATVHTNPTERANFTDAYNKRHTHSNKSILDEITSMLIESWNTAKTHADSTHARTDATNVTKSTTNGNILINGTETNVYTHPNGTNPHGTTKSDIGLGNVENKSSATIRSELTKEDVTDALGYTPPTTNTTYSASNTMPKANGTAAIGSETAYARGDHVHPAQASVSGNAGTATKWATARNINGMSVQGDANRINYCTCSTAAATAAKIVACAGFTLIIGAEITVKFTITNTAANPTLNVNGTGAKAIYYRGTAIYAGYLAANRTYTFRYNGTQYELVGDINTNTTYGIVSTSANGLCPKRDGSTSKFLRGDGTWATPSGGGITYSDSQPTSLTAGMTWIGN